MRISLLSMCAPAVVVTRRAGSSHRSLCGAVAESLDHPGLVDTDGLNTLRVFAGRFG